MSISTRSALPVTLGVVLTLLASSPAYPQGGEEEPNNRDELLALLAEQTELATKTRLNADYVPGIVDILHGDELEERGAHTVWDALAFVPGVQPTLDQTGHRLVVVRGLGSVGDNWSSGNVKFLLNGVSVNNSDRGQAETIFFIPVSQVERIEVIRGPGSAVHGEFAVAGVINIITRANDNRAVMFTGSHGQVGGGIVASGDAGPWRYSLNLSSWRDNGVDAVAGTDSLYHQGLGSSSYAPGPANEGIVARNATATLRYRGFSLLGQWGEDRLGDYFGVNYQLPPNTDKLVQRARMRQFEARYRTELPRGKLELYVGDLNHLRQKNDLFADVSEYFGVANGPDAIVDENLEEERRYWGADLTWEIGRHNLLVGVYDATVNIKQSGQSYNLLFDPNTGTFNVTNTQYEYGYPVAPGTRRRLTSLTLQDEFRASDHFSVTGGMRYDDYTQIGSSVTPRIAGVWRFGEQQVVKAQYAQAFRPPSMFESAAGDPDLKPVTIDTTELGYIRKFPQGEWRATAAYSELRDIILFVPANAPYFYTNVGSARLRSLELDGKLQLPHQFKVWGSVALNHTDLSGGTAVPGSSDTLLRVGLRHRFSPRTSVDLEQRWVSGFARQLGDPRATAKGYATTDVTLSHRFRGGFSCRLGVANLFDSDVRYPAFLATDTANNTTLSYAEDLPRAGRTWWAKLSKDL